MNGRRIYSERIYPDNVQPGDYWRCDDVWYCETPNGHTGSLLQHDVTEHENGTITVTPSILVERGDQQVYHGFLNRGEWRPA